MILLRKLTSIECPLKLSCDLDFTFNPSSSSAKHEATDWHTRLALFSLYVWGLLFLADSDRIMVAFFIKHVIAANWYLTPPSSPEGEAVNEDKLVCVNIADAFSTYKWHNSNRNSKNTNGLMWTNFLLQPWYVCDWCIHQDNTYQG